MLVVFVDTTLFTSPFQPHINVHAGSLVRIVQLAVPVWPDD